MRVFVSSTFEDLREHRAAAIRVLRQLGHEVVAMEDFVAASAVPLNRVLEDVKRCQVYVGIFAWRYGFVPEKGDEPGGPVPPPVPGAEFGRTSITHYEYLQARHSGLDILAFLLDDSWPWPPHLIDGFAPAQPAAQPDNSDIRALRRELKLQRIVSYFTSPADLEARVGAAVTVAGMSRQVRLNLVSLGPPIRAVPDSDPYQGIRDAIRSAGEQRVLKVDLAMPWWSTRLYLTAALAERLTQVCRIVVVRGEDFVGLLSTATIVSALPPVHDKLRKYNAALQAGSGSGGDMEAEMKEAFLRWGRTFGAEEPAVKLDVTPERLKRWFGDAMLQQPVRINDLAQASVVDLLRVLDYPNDFVPVVSSTADDDVPAAIPRPVVKVIDKAALNSQLAQSYVLELMDRARIS